MKLFYTDIKLKYMQQFLNFFSLTTYQTKDVNIQYFICHHNNHEFFLTYHEQFLYHDFKSQIIMRYRCYFSLYYYNINLPNFSKLIFNLLNFWMTFFQLTTPGLIMSYNLKYTSPSCRSEYR